MVLIRLTIPRKPANLVIPAKAGTQCLCFTLVASRDDHVTSLCFFTRHPWRASHFSLLAQREVTKRKGTPGAAPPLRGGSLRAAGFR